MHNINSGYTSVIKKKQIKWAPNKVFRENRKPKKEATFGHDSVVSLSDNVLRKDDLA